MKSPNNDFFWPSYTDLMTSLFFVMLVLYVLTYRQLNNTIQLQKQKLAIIQTVEENLKPLKNDSLFTYEENYKRFKLAFNVKFTIDKYHLIPGELNNYYQTIDKISKAGNKLKNIITNLKQAKDDDSTGRLKNISYILVIAGYASRDKDTSAERHNNELSYQRALSLKNYWLSKGINFEEPQYKGLIDLQISGNGWGGVGRTEYEEDNQRFLIEIFPKIGDIR